MKTLKYLSDEQLYIINNIQIKNILADCVAGSGKTNICVDTYHSLNIRYYL